MFEFIAQNDDGSEEIMPMAPHLERTAKRIRAERNAERAVAVMKWIAWLVLAFAVISILFSR
jgi:hypothetical protein